METDIVAAAEQAGIVGAGGAGFPTHVKLNTKADTVIINGAECEPLLRVDQQLIAKYPQKLLHALNLMVEHLNAKEGIIALKRHYIDAVIALKRCIINYPRLRIFLLEGFYPAGDEQVLVTEVTGKIVPEGGIPIHVGVVVSNVETVLNLYDACMDKITVTHTYITIIGEVAFPKTIKVPLGITVKEALDIAGGTTISSYAIINGGPMMGTIVDEKSTITKTAKGFIVLPKKHELIMAMNRPLERSLKDAAVACMQCFMCTEICPRQNLGHRLHPHKLMRMASYGSLCDKQETPVSSFLCCGCRLCEYACVMQLQPWKLNKSFKNTLAKNGIRNHLSNTPKKPDPFRESKRYPVKKLILQLGLASYDMDAPLEDTHYTPNRVAISLKQHVGELAVPVVKLNEEVHVGMCIARIPKDKLGANIHASMSGKIVDISNEAIIIQA